MSKEYSLKSDAQIGKEIGRKIMGGEGSGFFGHSGRPGEVGGSGEGADVKLSPVAKRGIKLIKSKYGYNEVEKGIWKVHIGGVDKWTTDSPEIAWSFGDITTFLNIEGARKNLRREEGMKREGVEGL